MRLKDILEIDFLILLPVIILMVLGIIFIYSAGASAASDSNEYIRQIVWASVGLAIALVFSMLNYGRLHKFSHYIYLLSLIPLIFTIIFGQDVFGARRWLRIGPLGIQPSEFVKITSVIFLARYLADTRRSGKSFIRFLVSCIIIFIPMSIVFVQPDLGTAIVFFPILIIMLYVAGITIRYIIFTISCFLLIATLTLLSLWQAYIYRKPLPLIEILNNPLLTVIILIIFCIILGIALIGYLKYRKPYFYWMMYVFAIIIISLGVSFAGRMFLSNYQIMRLIVFLDPGVDSQGAGWHIIQSVTAIGGGGLFGKGLLQGTLSQFRFLPQKSTDFIFSIFSEEAGFIGGLIVFSLFLIIFLRIIRIMKTTIDPFAEYICTGLLSIYVFHFIINVGMAMGIMPITGIPLSFMSSGGSALISSLMGIGIIQSIHVRRYLPQTL